MSDDPTPLPPTGSIVLLHFNMQWGRVVECRSDGAPPLVAITVDTFAGWRIVCTPDCLTILPQDPDGKALNPWSFSPFVGHA